MSRPRTQRRAGASGNCSANGQVCVNPCKSSLSSRYDVGRKTTVMDDQDQRPGVLKRSATRFDYSGVHRRRACRRSADRRRTPKATAADARDAHRISRSGRRARSPLSRKMTAALFRRRHHRRRLLTLVRHRRLVSPDAHRAGQARFYSRCAHATSATRTRMRNGTRRSRPSSTPRHRAGRHNRRTIGRDTAASALDHSTFQAFSAAQASSSLMISTCAPTPCRPGRVTSPWTIAGRPLRPVATSRAENVWAFAGRISAPACLRHRTSTIARY